MDCLVRKLRHCAMCESLVRKIKHCGMCKVKGMSRTFCTFDLNLPSGPWKSRILLCSHRDYCWAGQKNEKFHLGHCMVIIIGWDMIDCNLLRKITFTSQFPLLASKYLWRFLFLLFNLLNSLTAMGRHDGPFYNKLCVCVISLWIFWP